MVAFGYSSFDWFLLGPVFDAAAEPLTCRAPNLVVHEPERKPTNDGSGDLHIRRPLGVGGEVEARFVIGVGVRNRLALVAAPQLSARNEYAGAIAEFVMNQDPVLSAEGR